MDIRSIRTPGLGDATYILGHNGLGIVIDPQRDIERFLVAADEMEVNVRYVLETHVHNDYISGCRELAHETGADLILPAGAGVAFDHVPAFHGEELGNVQGLTIRPIHTPGHTPEHVSYLVLLDGQPVAVFSGGSLLVGAAGRPDLLGMPRARQLGKLQYGSVSRLAALPDEVGLYPTHGEGSFCAVSGAGRSVSTIGIEKLENPYLKFTDADSFAAGQLEVLGPYPKYYPNMSPINTLGPTPLPSVKVPEMTAATVAARDSAVWIVDGRPGEAFAAGHIPDSVAVELDDSFGTWVGWLLPFNAPIILVLEPEQSVEEAVVQLGRIGFDQVLGVLRNVASWADESGPLESFTTVDVTEFAHAVQSGIARQVLDVRAPAEWASGHLETSIHHYVADLAESTPSELSPAEPVWVACATGYRASIAASLLERAGYRPVALRSGGIPDVLSASRSARSSAELVTPNNI